MKLDIQNEIQQVIKENIDNIKPRLIVDVNNNPTKKGVKIQFAVNTSSEAEKNELTVKLKNKLNSGLAKYDLTVDTDTDVPYNNVIGFTIYISQFKVLIKNILTSPNENEHTGNEEIGA